MPGNILEELEKDGIIMINKFKIAKEELEAIMKIANGHRITLSALANK